MVGIIVKRYEHYNRALDTHVKSKDHYDTLMKKGNYISYEECVDKSNSRTEKPYVISKKALDIIKVAKNSADKKGNIRGLGDRTIDAMKDIGAIGKKIPKYMNVSKENIKGGFSK